MGDGKPTAEALGLPCTIAAFSLPSREEEQSYFDLFEEIVDEVRTAYKAQPKS